MSSASLLGPKLRVVGLTTAVLVAALFSSSASAQFCPADTVSREQLAEALRFAVRSHEGGAYDIHATTNWTRLESALYLRLVRRALSDDRSSGVLFIPADRLFWEYLNVAGLEREDEAPEPRRLAFQYDQGVHIDYRGDSIVSEVKKGSLPILAVNVLVAWPDRPDGVRKYGFVDSLSVPRLKVTNHQVITYRLLDFGDMIAYDKIDGLTGRPLSGLLGALFSILGEGGVKYSRFIFSDDGLQIVRARAKKIFFKTVTVTVEPSGRAEKDLPPDRPDLEEIEERLKQDLDIEYYPYRCW